MEAVQAGKQKLLLADESSTNPANACLCSLGGTHFYDEYEMLCPGTRVGSVYGVCQVIRGDC
jgi:hypothetical protein